MTGSTSILALIGQLSLRGVRLKVDGGKLRCRGTKSVLTSEVMATLLERKAELIAFLTTSQAPLADDLWILWGDAVEKVATLWNAYAAACRARGDEPAWLNDLELTRRVEVAIRSVTDSISIALALDAIWGWEEAWRKAMVAPSPVVPRSPEDFAILRAADFLADEDEGRLPRANATVHRALNRARSERSGARDTEVPA